MSSRFSSVNLGVEIFSSDLPETGQYDLVCVCAVLVDDKATGGWLLFYWELMLL